MTRRSFWPSIVGLTVLLVAGAFLFMRGFPWLGVFAAGGIARVLANRRTALDGALEIGEEALSFNGLSLGRRAEVETALLIPRRKRKPIVLLKRRRGPPVHLEVDGTQEGRALIRALGLDPRQTVATLSLPALNQRARAAAFALAATVGLLALVSIPLLESLLPAGAIVIAVLFYLVFNWLTRTTLSIGGDGVRIQYLGKRRFIGHDEIERVATFKGTFTGVELALRRGDLVRLPTATHAEGDGGLASGIVSLLEGARPDAREDVAREESILARAGRRAGDWLREMRSLAAGSNIDHRTAPLDPARVWQVLNDHSAEASARVGAAAFLTTIADEDERARLRVAAKSIAAPRVRVAVDALVAGEDEGAVLEALDAVQDAETDASGPRRRQLPRREIE